MKLLNQVQAADMLGMSISWMERKRWEGGGPKYIKIKHAVRYRKEDLEEWINERLRSSTSECQRDCSSCPMREFCDGK
ncbi:MAG: helix-turn-helix domain-containing protein [Alphaproteobacteria bacterium]